MRRWLVRLGVGAVVLVVVIVGGAKLLLRTGFAANRVAAQIQEAVGGPTRVGHIDVGVTGSSLHDLQFLEEDAPEGTPPWAVVPTVDADLSLAQLARGDLAGGTITLRGPKLHLRLDRDNNILTKFPTPPEGPAKPWPEFKIVNAQVRFEREGEPEALFNNISGTLRKAGERITLEGTVADQEWGNWTVGGNRAGIDEPFKLKLQSVNVRVTPDKLRRIPFVPSSIWEHVSLDGETPVDLALQFGGSGGGPAVRYRVALSPHKTTVRVPSIDLTTRDTNGKAVVEDGVVTLNDVRGETAGGALHLVKSDMDFRGDGSKLRFVIGAERLVLRELPAKWGLPKWDGRMTGRADLTLDIKGGQVRTSGGGEGTIEGFLSQKLQVKMLADERGYRFDVSNAAGAKGRTLETPPAFLFPPPLGGREPEWFAKLLATGLVTVQPADPPPAGSPPPAGHESGQTIRLNLGLQDVSLAELVQKLDLKLPIRLDGKLSFRVQATIPLSDAKNLKLYHATGTVDLPWARIEDLWLQQVKARIVFENGVLRLDELSARQPNQTPTGPPTELLPGGTVLGTAALSVDPTGDLTADLKVTALPVGQLLRAIPNSDPNGAGTADGDVRLRAPAGALSDVQKWEASGRLVGRGLRAFGRSVDEVSVQARLDRGVLHVTEARAKLQGATVGGSGQVTLSGQYPYQAKVELPPSELRAWQQVLPELRSVRLAGTARVTADARGTLSPLTVLGAGTVHVDGLAVNDFRVGNLDTRWEADADRVRLSEIAARLYGGALTGTATIPVKPQVAGRVDLKLDKVDTTTLTKDLPQTSVRLEGAVEGSVMANIPPAGANGEREITADVNLSAERLRVQNIPADRLKASVVYRNGAAEYKIQGETLGGTFDLNGTYPDRPGEQGRIDVRRVDLARLADSLRIEALRPLAGRLDVEAGFTTADTPSGAGRMVLTNLGWGGRTVTDQLIGTVRVANGAVRVEDVSGQVAGGSVRARFTYDFLRPNRSTMLLTAQRVDARTLLAPFTDSPPLDGPLEVRLFTRFGTEWAGSGQVVMGYGKLFGVTVRDARFPLGWAVAPGRRGELRLHDAAAQASRGRLTAQAKLTWGEAAQLDGQARFSAIDVGELLSHYSESRVVGGLATGRADFGGRNMRSVKDLWARVEAKLAEAVPSQMPVARQVMPFILPGVGANVQFTSGDLRGVLGGGVFRLENLSLVGQMARVFAEGTVTVEHGRLNLEVVANTNQLGMDPAVLRTFGLALPMIGPIPVGLLNEATGYLSNRTIRLHVGGTVRAPAIQVNPAALLSESAVRFFVGQTGVPVPTAALRAPAP